MATIDLGKIKQVFRGTYNNSTAYAVDDLVVFTDGSVTSTYICTTASTGNNPSSGGTAHASWAYVAKGVADPIPSQSGNAGKALKTNGSALSWGTAGGILGVKEVIIDSHYAVTAADWTYANSAFKIDYTATSTTSHFLLEAYMGLGMNSHDDMFQGNWFDSLKGTSASDILFPVSTGSAGSRATGTFPLMPAGAAVSAGWNNYWLAGHYMGAKYYPASGQRSTSARSFYPCFIRNGFASSQMFVNYTHTNHQYGFIGNSVLRVTEIEGSIAS